MRFILACTPKLAQLLEVPVEQFLEAPMLLAGHLEIIIPRPGSGYGEGDTPAALFRACCGQLP
jgi:hypothetical protein